MNNKLCPNCGFINSPESRFCQKCGSPLPNPSSVAQDPVYAAPGKKKPWVWILVLAAVGMLSLGGGLLFFMNQTKPKDPEIYTLSTQMEGNSYSGPLEVLIKIPDGTEVYYTTDQSQPSSSSSKYNAEKGLILSSTKTVKAVAIDQNGRESNVVDRTFSVKSTASADNSTNTNSSTSSGSSSSTKSTGSTISDGSSSNYNYADNSQNTSGNSYGQSDYTSTSPAVLVADVITWGEVNMDPVENARRYKAFASSVLAPQGSNTYVPSNLLDGNPKTTWTEGVAGDGIGEYFALTYQSSAATTIQYLYFYNGYCKSDTSWNENGCVTKLGLKKNGQRIATIYLTPTSRPQCVTLPKQESLVYGDTLEFVIESAQQGTDDSVNDTCVSEIIIV